jgi:hypothetical protein
MHSHYKYIFLLAIAYSNFFLAQLPQEEKMMVRITKEVWIGGMLHTNGMGMNFNTAKFKTYKKKQLFNLELLNLKHEKEYKIFGSFDENAKKYVYGKLNSLYTLRIGMGRRKILFEKLRENGLQLALNWTAGPSFGLIKPIYLEVFKYDLSGKVAGVSLERYDPEEHNIYNIYGRGPWAAGLIYTKINPGLYFKAGLEFDYSNSREIINSIELGFAVDSYLNTITTMVDNKARRVFPILYLNLSVGNKFY